MTDLNKQLLRSTAGRSTWCASPATHDLKLRIFRINELAERLGVHEQTIWRWSRKGKFPKPVKLGEMTTGWRACDIERWLDEKQAANAS
jgi:prophage regulatory protein